MRFPPMPPAGDPAELLLVALVGASTDEAHVEFDARRFSVLIGLSEEKTAMQFHRLQGRRLVSPLEGVSELYQVHPIAVKAILWRAAYELDGMSLPRSHQDAAQALLILRLHS